MKRIISLLLTMFLLLLTGCGASNENIQPTTTTEATMTFYYNYPGLTGIPIGEGLDTIPKSIYTQPASENGLAGTRYFIKGTVAETGIMDSMPYFIVTTDQGDVLIGNAAILASAPDASYELDIEKLEKYYPIPPKGQPVCVYAEYKGWSDRMDIPAFFYGSTDYLYSALRESTILPNNTEPTGTAFPTETTVSTEPPALGTIDNPYYSGMYKVGTDLPAGEYLFTATGSYRAYVCASTDSNQDDIIENENFNGSFFMTVKDGQYLEASRCQFVLASEATVEINQDGSFGEGMYRVGIDIPAGEYKLTADSDTWGYWCIYNNTKTPFDIVNNDNFDNSTYVTVRKGQYLQLSRCTAKPV